MRSHHLGTGLGLLLLGGLMLSAVHLLGLGGPPVYDGLPVPADRYRYLDPPLGVHSPGPPFVARTTIQLVGGANPAIDIATGEYPPQAELWLGHGDVDGAVPDVPPVASALVTITPVKPPTPPPPGRQFHGNVYAMQVVAADHALGLHPDAQARVALRQPRTSSADPRIAVLIGGHWQLLDTHPTAGAGVLGAELPQLGDVAILEKTTGFVASKGHFGLWLGLGLALLAVAAAAAIRVYRVRRSAPTGAKP